MDPVFLVNLYRNRFYCPLLLFILLCLFVPKFRHIFTNAAERIDRNDKTGLWAFITFITTFLLSLLMIYEGKSWGGDYSQYFAQARALATNTIDSWYDKNSFIIFHSVPGAIGSDVYPWLWAILLLPFQLTTGLEAYTLLKVYVSLYLAGAAVLFMLLFRRRMPLSRSILLSGFIVLNANYLFSINALDSDIPGLFFAALSLYLIDRYLQNRWNRSNTIRHRVVLALLAGFSIFLSVQCRSMSMTLLLALAAFDLLQLIYTLIRSRKLLLAVKKSEYIICLLPYLVYFIADFIVKQILPVAGGTYIDYFTPDRGMILFNLKTYFDVFASYFGSDVNASSHVILHLLAGLLLVFALAGVIGMIVRQLKQDSTGGNCSLMSDFYMLIYSCGTMLMLLLYEFYRISFSFPVFPILLLFAWYGVRDILYLVKSVKLHRYLHRLAAVFALVCVFLIAAESMCYIYAVRVRHYAHNEVTAPATEEVFEYIRNNVSDDSVVYFFKPRVLYYYTNVYSYYWFDDEHLDLADYILLGPVGSQNLTEMLATSPESYALVFENDTYKLYQVAK